MPRQRSDFLAGVEAAAKWLREQPAKVAADGKMDAAELLAKDMLTAIADDPEGTEARTVAQIVQYIRECAYGQSERVGVSALERIANSIERSDWKRQ